MPDFRRRSMQPELMDTAAVDAADHAACLRDLAAVNTVTLARLPTLAFIRRAVRRAGRPLRVLDVACGEGDMLRRLRRWSRHTGHALSLTGIDLNPLGIDAARAAAPADSAIEFRVGDALRSSLDGFDVVISSLFTHHLEDDDVVRFVRRMEQAAAVGWFINDLHRDRLAFHGFRALSGFAGWHRFVRHDGPVSVARSFRRADWRKLLARADVGTAASIRWHLPYRYCISRLR